MFKYNNYRQKNDYFWSYIKTKMLKKQVLVLATSVPMTNGIEKILKYFYTLYLLFGFVQQLKSLSLLDLSIKIIVINPVFIDKLSFFI